MTPVPFRTEVSPEQEKLERLLSRAQLDLAEAQENLLLQAAQYNDLLGAVSELVSCLMFEPDIAPDTRDALGLVRTELGLSP